MKVNAYTHPLARYYRCYLDGVDVSPTCFKADEEESYVLLYKCNSKGNFYIDSNTGEIASERLKGTVVLRRQE